MASPARARTLAFLQRICRGVDMTTAIYVWREASITVLITLLYITILVRSPDLVIYISSLNGMPSDHSLHVRTSLIDNTWVFFGSLL